MRATTGYKALLRYLYRREEALQYSNHDLEQVLNEMRHLDSKIPEPYGLAHLGTARSYRVQLDVVFLQERGFVRYQEANPHVELTELGRGFASQLKFPDELEAMITGFCSNLQSAS